MTALATLDTRRSLPDLFVIAGKKANEEVKGRKFERHQSEVSANTNKAQAADLAQFAEFLAPRLVDAGVAAVLEQSGYVIEARPGDVAGMEAWLCQVLPTEPAVWGGITYGLVEGFRDWRLTNGDAISTVNRKLSTVKKYASLAFEAGYLPLEEHAMIRLIVSIPKKKAQRVDENRRASQQPTRRGLKKAQPVEFTYQQALRLKTEHPDTPQGRRDALLMSLLLDLGLRCGEVARLTVNAVDLENGWVRVERPKVGMVGDDQQTHELKADSLEAAQRYVRAGDAPVMGALLRGSRRGGSLTHAGMTERSIAQRVRELGERVGIQGLSPHDCRHHWATRARRQGTSSDDLQDAGGWASPAMVKRYVRRNKIANAGVRL